MLLAARLSLVDYATVVAGVAAILALLDYGRSLFRRTVGRRYDAARRLQRLGTGAQLAFFEAVLGEPPAMRRTFTCDQPDYEAMGEDDEEPPLVTRPYVESYFIDPLYYVQTVSDADDSVVGFSITTRSSRFKPRLSFPMAISAWDRFVERITFGKRTPYSLIRLRLGQTTFSDAFPDWVGPFPAIRSNVGARTWSYTELHYFGNPGFYQDVGLTMSSAAAPRADPGRIEWADAESEPWLPHEEAPEDWRDVAPEWLLALRNGQPVTTITVIGMPFPVDDWPSFGPHGDEVRTLP